MNLIHTLFNTHAHPCNAENLFITIIFQAINIYILSGVGTAIHWILMNRFHFTYTHTHTQNQMQCNWVSQLNKEFIGLYRIFIINADDENMRNVYHCRRRHRCGQHKTACSRTMACISSKRKWACNKKRDVRFIGLISVGLYMLFSTEQQPRLCVMRIYN